MNNGQTAAIIAAIIIAALYLGGAFGGSYALMMADPNGIGDDIELASGLTAEQCDAQRVTAWHYCKG